MIGPEVNQGAGFGARANFSNGILRDTSFIFLLKYFSFAMYGGM